MNFRHLKILLVALGLVFIAQGCFLPPPPGPYHHHHHRGYRHHSSIQQSETQMTAQDSGDLGGQGQVSR